MTVQVDFWYLVGLLLGFLAVCGTGLQILLTQAKKHIDEKFATQELSRTTGHEQLSARLNGIESANREEALQWQRVERELLTLKADLPLHYVRREDYIRGQSVIEAKLDGLVAKLETAQLRARSNT
jgi:hypothetical protein